jgi:hypothetical protein
MDIHKVEKESRPAGYLDNQIFLDFEEVELLRKISFNLRLSYNNCTEG